MKEYIYNLEIVFDGTGDNMYPVGFRSQYTDIQDIKDDIMSQITIHVHPHEAK
jgi:hypothetical protein